MKELFNKGKETISSIHENKKNSDEVKRNRKQEQLEEKNKYNEALAEKNNLSNIDKYKIKYGLNYIYSDDLKIINKLAANLSGSSLTKTGMLLSGSHEDLAKIHYLSALVEQNWLLYNSINRLNENIEKLINLSSEE